MTEELGVIGDDGRCNTMRRMSGDTPQSRVSRYKEERRKQLASQFAHLSRNQNRSSSPPSASDTNFRKTTFKQQNLNTIQDDDLKKSKTTNLCKNSNKTHCKEDSAEDDNLRKKKSNGVLSSDSAFNHTSKNNRDKSAKRKSYLNRSINVEKTPTFNHSHNQRRHTHYHSADEGNVKKWSTHVVTPSSLPVPVESPISGTTSALSLSSSTSTSSHKPYPSPTFKRQLRFANSSISSVSSKCNGFAQSAASIVLAANSGSASSHHLAEAVAENRNCGSGDYQHRLKSEKDAGDKSKIPRRIASPSRQSLSAEAITNGSGVKFRDTKTIVTEDICHGSTIRVPRSEVDTFSTNLADNTARINGDHSSSHHNHLLSIIQNFSDDHHHSSHTFIDCPSNNGGDEDVDCPETPVTKRMVSSSVKYSLNAGYHGATSPPNSSLDIIEEDVIPKQSILKNKFSQRSNSLDPPKPNSILKRKTFEDIGPIYGTLIFNNNCSNNMNTSRQGILKKHSSLDEEEVRRRSCSPDVFDLRGRVFDFKPILKPHRRSSLEELVQNRSPELHSILKRTKPNTDEHSDGAGSSGVGALNTTNPQSILKRKAFKANGGNHHQPTSNAERHSLELSPTSYKDSYFVDGDAAVKPILKNKQNSLEVVPQEMGGGKIALVVDVPPRPILKKKQPSETEPDEEQWPKKPILKSCRKSSDEEDVAVTGHVGSRSNEGGRTIKPILKKNDADHYHFMETRTVKSDDDTANGGHDNQMRVKRHSLPGTGILTRRSYSPCGSKESSFSLAKGISNLENFLADESVIRNVDFSSTSEHRLWRNRFYRNSERFKTQPITRDEIVSSRSVLEQNQRDEKTDIESMDPNDENQKPSDVAEESDNASKTDDQDVISKLRRSNSVSMKASLFSQLEKDNKKAVEEQKTKKKNDSNVNRRKLKIKCSDLSSRFATQPVTVEELAEAKKLNLNTRNKITDIKSAILEDSNKKQLTEKLIAEISLKHKLRRSIAENSSETSSQSEGDTSSSGGREIQKIIKGKLHQTEKHVDSSGVKKMHCASVVAESKDVVDECPVINGTSSIAQRLAALQKSGQLDWKKRISRIAPENELSPIIKINETQEILKKELANGFRTKIANDLRNDEKKDGTLAERLEKLETSRQTWKKRVEPSDAVQFSVAGKMASTLTASPIPSPDTSLLSERKKRGPQPSRFRSFREQKKETHSVPTTPEKSKSTSSVCRSNSLPSDVTDDDEDKIMAGDKNCTVVNVPQIFDEEFSTFFGKLKNVQSAENVGELAADFSDLKIESPRLLPTHKKIKAQRKHATSGNPLKTLSTRIEIKNEYREVKTNVAEREIKRLNVEKFSKNSTLAVEALAGLASKEDFQAVQLKKAAPLSSPMLPYKPLMLLHIKGRRHVQTRLVQPVVESINSGDSYILLTPKEIYHWIGRFSNVIERSRGAEIAQHVFNTHDLGCSAASQVHTIVEDTLKTNSKILTQFWKLLGATAEESASIKAVDGGHPDEDEIYENALLSTNMIYEATEEELIPVEKFWGAVPKIQILDPNKILVFDFGSELYVWMGKNVDLKLRKSSVKLAKELWDNGFNYEECDLCPITSAAIIGDRNANDCIKKGKERPDWCLFAKVTQHMETVLFREKFLDWPDFSRVIRQKGKDEDTEKQLENSHNLKPCNVEEMLAMKMAEPDLMLEGSHLGRGDKYFDNERRKYYLITTLDVRMWHIAEFESEDVPNASLGQFFSTDSYVIRWQYSISYTGRELSGLPSKHTTVGRDRCVYFCWQGKNASLNEQGAAALLTVELDQEKGVQLRICQGYEPPAFFNLFKGRTVIYRNKTSGNDKAWKLFICRGELESEAALLEVSCNIKQLRSRAAFVLLNLVTGTLFLWQGCKVTKTAAKVCRNIVNSLRDQPPPELGLHSGASLKICEIIEGSEPKEFFSGLGGSSKKLYLSLVNDSDAYDSTPILYNLSSTSGVFCAIPIWSSCRSTETVTAYPFLQEDLYAASQPALFLMDTGKELWLWQGWWPEREKNLECDQTNSGDDEPVQNPEKDRGSASVRWQVERRAAMQTALDYWKCKYSAKPVQAYLVWAGLEPIEFTNLFPDWDDRDDVAEMNILDGRKPGEMLNVEQELERLTQSTYPIEQLLQRPLPDGVDPTKLELYLSPSHFKEILKMSREEFAALPSWKKTNLKKNAGLF